MGLSARRRRWRRRALSPKPGVSHSRSTAPSDVSISTCPSAVSVTWASSRTSPTSRRSSVRASVVLPTFVCDTSDSVIMKPSSRCEASGAIGRLKRRKP